MLRPYNQLLFDLLFYLLDSWCSSRSSRKTIAPQTQPSKGKWPHSECKYLSMFLKFVCYCALCVCVCCCCLCEIQVTHCYMLCVCRHSLWPLLSPPDSFWGSVTVSLIIPRRASPMLSIRLVWPGSHQYLLLRWSKQIVCISVTASEMCISGSCLVWPVQLLKEALIAAPYMTQQHQMKVSTWVVSSSH